MHALSVRVVVEMVVVEMVVVVVVVVCAAFERI